MRSTMRYYFHVVVEGFFYLDDQGEDFLTYDRALVHAMDVAKELLESDDFADGSIVIDDEEDGEIARFPIASARRVS
jgi:hypothetical protein